MKKFKRILSIIILLGIFMPYATVSCSGSEDGEGLTMSAAEMAIGLDQEVEDSFFSDDAKHEISIIFPVTMLVLLLIFGIYLTWSDPVIFADEKPKRLKAVYGVAFFLSGFMPLFLDYYVGTKEDGPNVDYVVSMEFGYFYILVLSCLMFGILLWEQMKERKIEQEKVWNRRHSTKVGKASD